MYSRSGKVSMKDVADRAGVSASTVSLVLSGKHSAIPEATRQRVLDAAGELGYRRNALAAGLRRQMSDTIGFISDLIATTPHAGAMVQGAQDAAWKVGKVLLMINTGGDPAVEHRAVAARLDRPVGGRVGAARACCAPPRQVVGLVYAAMYHRLIDPPPALREVPAVLLDARSDDTSLSSIAPDEEGGAFAATSALLDAGHRRIGYLQSDAPIPAAEERLQGYRVALESRGVAFDPVLVVAGIDEHPGGFAAASELLGRPDRPSAIFAFNDRMAAGAAHAAHRLGLSVPRDLSLVGFDNEVLVAPLVEPPLTTVQLPHYEMGRWAVEHLLQVAAGGAAEQHRIACPLVVRESVGPPAEESLSSTPRARSTER
jgi:LacI family transcriptional regulator